MTRRALITGGQRGIGLGIAKALQAEGFDIALVAEAPRDAPEVRDALNALPGATYHQHDLRDLDAIPALLDAVGPIATLVSNAGVPSPVRGDMLNLEPANYDFVLDINLKGAFFLAQAVAKRMIGSPSDTYQSILFVTSISADMVSVERAEYCLSKAGASMMAQLYAARLAGDGIGVFELRPGIIETDMTAGVRDKYTQRIEDGLVPAKRWGTPADIGSMVASLALGQMAFSTGAIIPVDGGLSIHRL